MDLINPVELKDSGIDWIGKIPFDWDVAFVKFFSTIFCGSFVIKTSQDDDAPYPVFNGGRGNTGNYKDYNYQGNLILISARGYAGFTYFYVGKAWIGNSCYALKSKCNFFWKFLFYALKNNEEVFNLLKQTTTIPALSQEQVLNSKISFCSFAEQQQIADYLDAKCSEIDSLHADIEKQIDVLEQYKKSVIYEVVTKGLDPNVEMKDSGIEWIGKIPKNWKIIRVKYKYHFVTGFTPDTAHSEFYSDDNGYEWVTIADMNTGHVNYPTKSIISRYYVTSTFRKPIPIGSLLYSFKLSVGQTAITDRLFFTNEAIASFLSSVNNNLKFLRYSSFLIEYNANVNIYGAKLLNQQLINDSHVVFPSLSEQQQIADYLDFKCSEIDSAIADKKKQLETLEDYKKSLIYEYVTGKKRVSVAS